MLPQVLLTIKTWKRTCISFACKYAPSESYSYIWKKPTWLRPATGPGPNERPIDWPFTPLVKILGWTATANGHQLLGWTATNFWGERPWNSGVNGHELMGWTATSSRVNEDFWGERPRTSEVNGHELLGWTATNSRVNGDLWGERPPILGWPPIKGWGQCKI